MRRAPVLSGAALVVSALWSEASAWAEPGAAPPPDVPATKPAAAAPSSSASSEPNAGEAPTLEVCIAEHRNAQQMSRQGRLLEAAQALKRCLHPVCSPPLRSECARVLEQVESDTPSLVFAARSGQRDLANVRVFDDGMLIAERLDGRPVELDPGAHQLRFEAPAHVALTQTVVVRVGERNRRLDVVLEPIPLEPMPAEYLRVEPLPLEPMPAEYLRAEPSSQLPWNAIVFGTGASLGVAGGVLAWLARSDYRDAQDSCAPVCSEQRMNRIEAKSIAADVLFTLSAATFAYGIVHVLTEQPDQQPSPSASLRVGPGSLSAEGRF